MAASLQQVQPPSPLPISMADAKAHLRVTHDRDDALINRMLAGACADAQAESGVGVGIAGYAAVFDEFPPGRCALPVPVAPVLSAVVEYIDADGNEAELSAPDAWIASRIGKIVPASQSWPATQPGRPEAVHVLFRAGHAAETLPHQVREAVFMILADRYEHRGDGEERQSIPAAAVRLLWQARERFL